ncbi:MAG: hypothetical protein ACW98J_07275 [Candidatus Thorarchaeota archaeon]|jgi:hypothetical protein
MAIKIEAHLMRKAMAMLLVALFLASLVVAVDFEERLFSDDGVVVYASASADTPWESPFTKDVSVSVSVWPSIENISWTSIASILVTVHSVGGDGSGFSLIASDDYDFTTYPEGGSHVNASATFTLTGGGVGSQFYFAVSVIGQYGNATDTFSYEAHSPEDLLGPFSISYSPATPQFLIGVAMIIVFTLVIVLGMRVFSQSRKKPTREALLKE